MSVRRSGATLIEEDRWLISTNLRSAFGLVLHGAGPFFSGCLVSLESRIVVCNAFRIIIEYVLEMFNVSFRAGH